MISVLNNTGTTLTYDWEPDLEIITGDSTSTITVVPNATGWFVVTASSTSGCVIKDSIRVYVSPLPSLVVSATADFDTIVNGSSTDLHAAPNGFSYSWTPAGSLDNPTIQHPNASPTSETTYTVTISDTGCVRTAQITIYVRDVICGAPDIYVPNAFTPGSDGLNNEFYAYGKNIVEFRMLVYDRWGLRVFESNDIHVGWDGDYSGKPAQQDVYVYKLYYTVDTESGSLKDYTKVGTVTLVR